MEVIIAITIIVTRWVEAKQGEEVKCLTLWTPLTDQGQEGVFKSLVSGNIHHDLAWGPGQPNGDTTENSVRMMTESELLEDVDSTKSDCFVCSLKKSFAAQLRGGCKAAKLERLMLRIKMKTIIIMIIIIITITKMITRLFYLRNTEDGGLVYEGWWGSRITFNKDSLQWEARHHTDPLSVLATINASAGSLLLGSHLSYLFLYLRRSVN